ncbi:MAG: YitT family protein [Halopseudomonas sp.]
MSTTSVAAAPVSHSHFEDLFALISGTTFVALGVFLFTQQGLLTGGTAGLALLLTHATSLSFGQIFFSINLPFYWLAWKQMGWRFCLNTFVSVFTVSVMVDYAGMVIEVSRIDTLTAAIIGGFLMGMGMLILFRHRSSLGGLGILALFLQSKYGIRAGKFQMAVDCLILMCSFFIVSWEILLFSVVGAAALNMVITLNHKPGRYQIT